MWTKDLSFFFHSEPTARDDRISTAPNPAYGMRPMHEIAADRNSIAAAVADHLGHHLIVGNSPLHCILTDSA